MSRGPGKWQRLILRRLRRRNFFPLAAHFADFLRRPLTRLELSALRRAAYALARDGKVSLATRWADKPRRVVIFVGHPNCTYALGDIFVSDFSRLSIQRGGTRTTLMGSLRDIAAVDGVSKNTVQRRLTRDRISGGTNHVEEETSEPPARSTGRE